MAVTLKGGPVKIGGQFLSKGQKAPDFSLADKTRADVGLAHFAGKRKVLNIFPSVDTPTCATSVRKFNEAAAKLNAGKKGPIPNPAAPKPIQTMTRLSI